MNDTLNYYKKSEETKYNAILCVIGGLIWGAFLLFVIKADAKVFFGTMQIVSYVLGFLMFFFVSSLLFRANAMGNMVLVNEEQFPHIYEMVVDGSKKLGIQPPETFLYNSNGLLNAFARQTFGRQYLLLTSSIVDAITDEQMKFIVGHELGHHAAGHLNLGGYILRFPARIVPFLHNAYSRQCEYTCDRLGLYVSRDLKSACQSIQMLGCGCQKLNTKLNLSAFEKQENYVPLITGYIAEILRTHPRLTKRVISLKNTKLID
jgi:Zn-dependent protease with chaperone function